MTAILEDILTAVQSEIQGLTLTDIASDDVMIQKVPSTRKWEDTDFPGIIIAPLTPKFNKTGGTNLRDEIEYQVGIYIVDADNQNQTSDRDKYLTWYETILKKFRTPRLTGVASVINSYVQPGPVVDPGWFQVGEFHSGIIVSFISWETR